MNSEFIRLPQILYLTGLGKSSIYKFMEEGHFPQSTKLGSRVTVWQKSDIQDWIKSKIQARKSR
jgi:prophage regulatory protein